MYDAIVIGSRCAGSPTAMLLAHRGHRVLLVDRAVLPRDTLSTHFIHPPGVACLARWGMLDQVVATGCPPVSHTTLAFEDLTLTGSSPAIDGITASYAPRRTVLDRVLLDGAIAAGVEVREGFAVQDLLTDGDRIVGIRGRGAFGSLISDRCQVVVGADGLHSLVARTVRPDIHHATSPLTCAYYSYWSGVPAAGLELHHADGRLGVCFPTNESLTVVYVAWPHREFHRFRADVEGNYLATLAQLPHLAERLRGGRREDLIRGTADLPNLFRRPHGPGWALVGDAGHHKDPNTAYGIMDAFRDAGLLVKALDAGFCGRRDLTEALAEYERERDRLAMPRYELTCQLAALEPPTAEMQQLFRALEGDQPQIDRFFGAHQGTVPIREFFASDNLRHIVAAAAAR
ncbi:MAG: oxidoreductase [Chloroflexi bacterium]|jgi:2-polyprenyl-6-methoxyphenol hydroxylase-like FAD-dependent oxidoreductase|nr:oxidoreductase [Chloroflexota bacterium]